jgi:hypothetical protein
MTSRLVRRPGESTSTSWPGFTVSDPILQRPRRCDCCRRRDAVHEDGDRPAVLCNPCHRRLAPMEAV